MKFANALPVAVGTHNGYEKEKRQEKERQKEKRKRKRFDRKTKEVATCPSKSYS